MRVRRLADDGGAIALLVGIMATVLFGFAAIVVDLGYARTVRSDAQNSVDAASLAGAGALSNVDGASAPYPTANVAIKKSALDNFGTTDADWAGCTAAKPSSSWVQGGSGTSCILFNRDENPTKLQVVLPAKHVDSFFGGLFGYQGMDITARAQTTIREEEVPGCALCVRGLLDTSGQIVVDSGGLGGSSAAGSGRVRNSGSITVVPPGAIAFTAQPNPAGGPSYSPAPRFPRRMTDPFAGRPLPAGPGSPLPFPPAAPTNDETCGPGEVLPSAVYRNITVTGTVDNPCTASGVIVVTGRRADGGLHVLPGGYLSATSSAIQFSCGRRAAPVICASPRAGGRLHIEDGGQITMAFTPPDQFSVIADPNNTSDLVVDGLLFVDGAVYGKSTAVSLGAGASLSASGPVSVAALTVDTAGSVTVNAAGDPNAPLVGPPKVALFQ